MLGLSIIGCGKVGTTLAKLWRKAGIVCIGQIINRTRASAQRAVGMIEEGEALEPGGQVKEADIWLISAPDDRIGECCRRLVAAGISLQGKVVFHCSGSIGSAVLGDAERKGAWTASIHPLKSFSHVDTALASFTGTYCAAEGHPKALEILIPLFQAIGGRVFPVDPAEKKVYHSGAVFVSNYLVSLIETGLRCFERAGVPKEDAMQILKPLVNGTLANIFEKGTVQALTGPISRGEKDLIREQIGTLTDWNPQIAAVYRLLGQVALELAREQGKADPEALRDIDTLLRSE